MIKIVNEEKMFTANHMVLTAKGLIKARKLKVNDNIISVDNNGNIITTKIMKLMKQKQNKAPIVKQ